MDRSLPSTPRSNHAPEFYISNGLEVASVKGYPTDHKIAPLVHGKSYGPEKAGNVFRYGGEEKQVHEQPIDQPRHRRRWLLITLLVFLIIVAAVIGGSVGGVKKHRADVAAQAQADTTPLPPPPPNAGPASTTASAPVHTGPPFNASKPLNGSTATPAQWRGKAIYQVLTDRFARADKSTTAPCDPQARTYCGGTWRGIMNNLDYIQNMGFTAIWISPVTLNIPQNTSEGVAYHGYWQTSLYDLNPNFGTAADLQALSQAVHARDMFLMVDVVVNHFGWAGDAASVDYSTFYPFNMSAEFHPYCPINPEDYTSNQTRVENCWLGDSTVSLVDVDTTNRFVIDTYYNWIQSFATTFAIDGLRIDTVKHVQKSFWSGFNKAAGIFCLGEVLNGDPSYTCPYQDVLDGVLNYPLYFALINGFSSSTGDLTQLSSTINAIKSKCKDSTLLGTFSENHDQPRFPSMSTDISLDKNVIAFTIMSDGIPIIYEGQEQKYSGGNDPNNREAIWLSAYSSKASLYSFIGSVNQIRNQEIYKSPDFLTSKASPIYADRNNLAMRKGKLVSVFSNSGLNSPNYTLTLSDTGYAVNQSVVEITTCSNVTIDAAGNLTVNMMRGEPRIFCPLSELKSSGICYL